MKFTTPPKARHSLSGMKRSALRPLQAHVSNPKLLVGAGSPRVATIGKSTKRSDLVRIEMLVSGILIPNFVPRMS